jgi:hypothetical protein
METKHFIGIFLISIVGIGLLIYILSIKNYNIKGYYTLYPMKFIGCNIKPGKNNKNFIVSYELNPMVFTNTSDTTLNKLKQKHQNINSKTAEINFTGNKGLLGHELEYIENGNKYPGVLLTNNFNHSAYKNDILIKFSEDSKIDTTSDCLLINDMIKCRNDINCKWFNQSCYDIKDIISNNIAIAFNKL